MNYNFLIQLIVVLAITFKALADDTIVDLVFIDLEVNGQPFGRLLVGLYNYDVPASVENFKALAAGWTDTIGTQYQYSGSNVFAIANGYVQTGNIDGSGGFSIYRDTDPKPDPEVSTNPLVAGSVALVTDANGNIGSQFIIAVKDENDYATWNPNNGTPVVVGTIIEGAPIIDLISDYARGLDSDPTFPLNPSQVVTVFATGSVQT